MWTSLFLVVSLLFGGEMTTLKLLPLLTKIGNPPTTFLGSVWQPWPQEDLWDVLKDRETGDAYAAESLRLHRYLYPYPLAAVESGSIRSEIKYDTIDLQRFDLMDSSLYFRWRPAINSGSGATPDYYMHFQLHDEDPGSNATSLDVEVLAVEGGDPALAVASPLPTQPGIDAGWKTHRWSPDGNYLATGGDANEVNLYSWDGSDLTLEGTYDPREATSYNFSAIAVDWDPTGTYLVVGGTISTGHPTYNTLAWFKRTGSSLTRLPAPTILHPDDPVGGPDVLSVEWHPDGTYVALGTFKRYRNALSIFKQNGDTSLDLIFPDPALPEDSPQSYGDWFGWADDPKSDVYGLSWAGDFLAAGHWGGDDDLHYLNMYEWDGVTEELAQISGGAPALPDYLYPYDLAFDPSGTYLTYSTDGGAESYGPDYSYVRVYKHDGSGFLTDLEVGLHQEKSGSALGKSGWDPTGTYFAAGMAYRTGTVGNYVYHKVVAWMKRTGDTFEQLTNLELGDYIAGLPTSDSPTSMWWHPSDDVIAGVIYTYSGSTQLFIVDVSGIGSSGMGLRISLDAWSAPFDSGDHVNPAPVIVSPYTPDLYAWLRVRHDSGTGTLYVETAPSGCGIWTVRMEQALPVTADLSKLGIMMNSWVDTNLGDTEVADPGCFGPFNPVPSDFTLPLLTLIGDAPLVGGTTLKILPLLTKIST